jgi:hypothetical protein
MKVKIESILAVCASDDDFLEHLSKEDPRDVIDPEALADYFATKYAANELDWEAEKEDQVVDVLIADIDFGAAFLASVEDKLLMVDKDKLSDALADLNYAYCLENDMCPECRRYLMYTPPTLVDPGDYSCPNGCM